MHIDWIGGSARQAISFATAPDVIASTPPIMPGQPTASTPAAKSLSFEIFDL